MLEHKWKQLIFLAGLLEVVIIQHCLSKLFFSVADGESGELVRGRKSTGAQSLTVKGCTCAFPSEIPELASSPWSLSHRLPCTIITNFGDLSMFEVVKKQNLPTGNWLTFYADTKQEILSIRFWGKDFLKRSFQCRSKSNWKEICSGWVF